MTSIVFAPNWSKVQDIKKSVKSAMKSIDGSVRLDGDEIIIVELSKARTDLLKAAQEIEELLQKEGKGLF